MNMMPHAKLFHSYAGLDGVSGQTMWRTKNDGNYGTSFLNYFKEKQWKYTHKIKMFFPEIRSGLLMVAGVQYSPDFNEDDKVTVTSEVKKGDNFNEYIEIEDFTAEIEIDIIVKFGRHGLSYPGSINCDFVDIYLFDQKISLITHTNTLLFVPYYMPYQTDFPFELARQEANYANLTSNIERKYGFVIPLESVDILDDIGFSSEKLSVEILDVDKGRDHMLDPSNYNGERYKEESDMFARSREKYIITFPMNIFPRLGEFGSELPVFDSEKCSPCCFYKGAGGGNLLASKPWKTFAPTTPDAEPSECYPGTPCKEEYQYEIRNKLINSFMRIADYTWAKLDGLVEITESERDRTAVELEVAVDEFDKEEEK